MKKLYFVFLMLFACVSLGFAQLVVADKTGWSVVSYDSQSSFDPATNAIDGNYGSIWHTSWDTGAPVYPHEIIVDMGKLYTSIPAFLYVPRQGDSENGMIKGYKIYFKENDLDAWGTPITGEFPNSRDLQAIDLSGQNISARYFKFEAISPQNESHSFASATELGIATTIDVTKKYNLKLSGENLYLQQKQIVGFEDNGDFTLQTLTTSDASYEYTFMPIGGKACVYNISVNNSYMNVSGGWRCAFGNIDAASPINSQFVLEEKAGAYMFRTLGRTLTGNRCIGLESKTVDSRIYGDATSSKWAYWELANAVSISPIVESKFPAENALDVYYRNTAIEVSFNRLVTLVSAAGVTVKDASSQDVSNLSVSVSGNKLTLTTAPLALNTLYTVTIPVGVIDEYTETITWSFTTANLTLPEVGVYNIINTNANYSLTYPEVAPKDDSPLSVSSQILSGVDADRQKFQLIVPDATYPDIYNIKENLTGQYLYLSQEHWRMGLITADPGSIAKFILIPDGSNYKIQALSNYGNNDYFAPDNENDGIGCYLNKQDHNVWQLTKVAEIPTSDKTVFKTNTRVSPTMSSGLITVTSSPATVKVVDVSGKECASYSSDGNIDINLNYSDGIYFVLVRTIEGSSLHKVVLKK